MTAASADLISALKAALANADLAWTVTSSSSTTFTPAPTGSPLIASPPVTTVTLSAFCETDAQDFVLTAIATLSDVGALVSLQIMAGGALLDATDADLWAAISAMRAAYETQADADAVAALNALGGN